MRVEVMSGFEVGAEKENEAGVGMIGGGTVIAVPNLIPHARAGRADVGVRVVAVYSPGLQHAIDITFVPRPTDVVHDLVLAAFLQRCADTAADIVAHVVPSHLL